MLFSRRNQHKSARNAVQVESVDEPARVRIWTTYNEFVFRRHESWDRIPMSLWVRNSNLEVFITQVWMDVVEQPTDTIPNDMTRALSTLRERHFKGAWYEVFDIMEVLVATTRDVIPSRILIPALNAALEREMVAYRVASSGEVVPITSDEELAALDEALAAGSSPVRTHIATALKLLADRTSPDYRNSIKESISAVEACVKAKTGQTNGTLGGLTKNLNIHAAFAKGLGSLYGYTSDADGIRHALMQETALSFAEAKFFLILCSAFVNYLEEKAS